MESSLTKIKPVHVEKIYGDRVATVTTAEIRPGDEVDVPVWIDIVFPPERMTLEPFAFVSFDRLVVVGARQG